MRSRLYLVANLSLLLILFLFGQAMSAVPGRSSGNGNPAILLCIPIGILFILLVFQWLHIFKQRKLSLKFKKISLFIVTIHIFIGVFYQVERLHKYKNYLAEANKEKNGFIDWEYIDSITDGLTVHVNNQYFNLNTYLICVSLSFLLGSIILHFKSKD